MEIIPNTFCLHISYDVVCWVVKIGLFCSVKVRLVGVEIFACLVHFYWCRKIFPVLFITLYEPWYLLSKRFLRMYHCLFVKGAGVNSILNIYFKSYTKDGVGYISCFFFFWWLTLQIPVELNQGSLPLTLIFQLIIKNENVQHINIVKKKSYLRSKK